MKSSQRVTADTPAYGQDYTCGWNGYACIDPDAACVDDDDITVALIENCGYARGEYVAFVVEVVSGGCSGRASRGGRTSRLPDSECRQKLPNLILLNLPHAHVTLNVHHGRRSISPSC